MLTKRTTTIARTKMAMVLTLAMACLLSFPHTGYSQQFERQGNKITYRGNTFELGKPLLDTLILIDPVTGKEITRLIQHEPAPEKINGKKIYQPWELTSQPKVYAQSGSIQDYVFRKISGMLNQLPDGNYDLDINSAVIDQNGKILYYQGAGLKEYNNLVTQDVKDAIADKIDEAVNDAPPMKPGQSNGQNVISLYRTVFANYEIEVKDHQSSLRETFK